MNGTARPSKGLKSTWILGRDTESFVARHFLNLGFSLVRKNWRTPFGEVDLWMQDHDGFHFLIEVKSLTHLGLIENRVSYRQKCRLERILTWFAEANPRARFLVVFVAAQGQVIQIPLADL